MSAPLIVAVAPGSPAALAGLAPGDEVARLNGQVPRDVIEWQLLTDEAELELDVRRGGIELIVDVLEARRRAARRRGAERGVRPGPHVRQPLRVLLHLPAAEGHAPEPLPQGRRLPAELPVRQLHDADPLHRGRSRAGHHRAAVAAAREHPRHRSRDPQPDAAQPAGRDEPALAAGAARPRDRGARSDRRVPGRQRRCRARRHDGRDARPATPSWRRWPSCRSGCRSSTPSRRCGCTPPPRRCRSSTRRRLAGRLRDRARAPHGVRRRRVLPDDRPPVPARRRRTTASRCTRTASAWRARSSSSSTASRRPRPGTASGFFAAVDLPGATRPRTPGLRAAGTAARATAGERPPARPVTLGPARRAPIGVLTGEFGARVIGPLIDQLGRDDVRVIPVRNEFFGGNTAVTGLMTGADLCRVLGAGAATASLPAARRLPLRRRSVPRRTHGRPICPRPVEVVATDGIALRARARRRGTAMSDERRERCPRS